MEEKITMFPASYGDTFLIRVNSSKEKKVNLLIDCGFGFKDIKEKLKEIDNLDRFIITHYDNDHIQSASKFLEENGATNSEIVSINQIWHNSYRHLQFKKRNSKSLSAKDRLKTEAFMAECNKTASNESEEKEIGAKQAIRLGSKILEQNYNWNKDFNDLAISIDNKHEISIAPDVSIILLSPNHKKLENLESEFEDKIEELLNIDNVPEDDIFDDAFEFYAQKLESDLIKIQEESISSECKLSIQDVEEFSSSDNYSPDNSVANGSSIAFILKSKEHQYLFLADSHSEIIEEQLKKLYPLCTETPLWFDAIKISHHGAQGNTSPNLLKLIDSQKFLISTNGKHPRGHKHPDKETIARIINRPIPKKGFERTIYMNYSLPHIIELFEDEALKNHYKYSLEVATEIQI